MFTLSNDFSHIDLRHLERDCLKNVYDIESTYNLFTIAFINDHSLTFMMFGDNQFDKYSDEYFIDKMKKYIDSGKNRKYMNVKSSKDLDYHIIRAYPNDKKSIEHFYKELHKVIHSRPMTHDEQYAQKYGLTDFSEYQGWNSYAYDSDMLVLSYLYLKNASFPKPSDIRVMSDLLIEHKGFPTERYEFICLKSGRLFEEREYRRLFNTLIYHDGHIDWAKIIQDSGGEGQDKVIAPGLKREMARFGLDIIVDDVVADSKHKDWSKDDVDKLIRYNFNDVMGTKVIGSFEFMQTQLETRDTVRKKYPYTSARFTSEDVLYKYEPAPRDITSSKLAARVIIGPYRNKPTDSAAVNYLFPVPDGDGREKIVDLWQYMKNNENYIHPYLITFFDHFRGKDTRTVQQDKRVKYTQPVTKKAMMNIPYFDKNNKPIDCMTRPSTGGSHGGEMVGLREMSEEEINQWIKSDIGVKKQNKCTIDLKNIIHVDWSSFYPTMGVKLNLYMSSDGKHRYKEIVAGRIEDKKKLAILSEQGKYGTPEYVSIDKSQEAQKLLLNAPTGEGNTHKKYAMLPLDNKTLSMRLIGNMLIWCLAQRLASEGAFIISTNTDGLYITGLSVEETQAVIDDYVSIYGMPVEPEPIKRFINRDVSTRIEGHYEYDEPTVVSGDLKFATGTTFKDSVIGRNLTFPLISGHAVIRYIMEDEDWNNKPYDRERLRSYILDEYNKEEFNPEAWYYIYTGTRSRRFLINDEIQDKVVRLIFTKNGQRLSNETASMLSKEHSINVYNQIRSGEFETFGDIIDFEDGESYQWANIDPDTRLEDVSIDFVQNKNRGRSNLGTEYQPVGVKDDYINPLDKDFMCNTIGFLDEFSGEWKTLNRWKNSKITHFTSVIGESLPYTEDLDNFNKEDIDIDAYLKWAENILDTWKVTNDIPQLNIKKLNDVVIEESKEQARKTKREKEIDTIWSYYGHEQAIV